ncbi:RidA family protein [Paracandidimonas soli]|uniref:2-iminobutanoate/2-iminopropanoate deaminase n=1 Tax=Paracandidimonas soli TaxID=1917182 RepID=A0A4V2VSL3_9BURK|nr:RidA family protein [Paracandidimonas soli]TCV02840.1 2-iminobutanoate/2-iminopropanoate deaminase [Paracandidimonas soli]
MKAIVSTSAPGAIGPYSQAILCGGFLFVSGQLPIDPQSGNLVSSDIAEQTDQVLANIRAIAVAAGTDTGKTVKTTIFLTDLGSFQAVNERYAKFFQEPFPARSTFQVAALPKGAKIEIEAIIGMG